MVSIKINDDQIIESSYKLIVYSYNIFPVIISIGPIMAFINCYLVSIPMAFILFVEKIFITIAIEIDSIYGK